MRVLIKACLGVSLALLVSACSGASTATRAAMPDDTMPGFVQPDFVIEGYTVSVPKSLTVNERNTYYPRGDIVWRGELLGDRHEQVKAIFEAGMRNASSRVHGSRPVRMDIQVLRFHGVSEKARYTVGGVHNIMFMYRLVDIATGAQFGPTKTVQADLEALAGQAAIAADAIGHTQKARIISHLTQVFVEELTLPGGHETKNLGLLQSMNRI